ATMSDENAQKDLIAKGFTPEQAQVTVQALKRTVKENPELLKAKADVRTESQEEYKFTVEQFNNENALRQQIKVLKEEMLNVSKANAKDLIELASSIAGFYGTASEAQNKSKNFGWNVNADASIKFVASVSGGVQGASSSGESTSVSGFTEEGKAKALQTVEKMSNEELNQYKEALINSYKEAIEGIEQQIAALKKNKVNDAVIPNGEIESVNLKDGTTLNVNENDGAVLTTNPLPEGLLSFAEGEVNPFDYLGYDGDKKECEYYETIFDEKEMKCNSFDDALALLE
ncbi:MAG: hypothetical protein KBT21_11555, partial [Treponema sp.]|nr:hypothetical protein [Candidatus Treponema merdequi]